MKICTKCKIEKSLDEFYPNASHVDGKCSWCKICDNIRNKKYRDNHKFEYKKWRVIYRLKNKEKISLDVKKYNSKHKKEKNKWFTDKYKKDINFKILRNLRRRMNASIKNNNKSLSTMFLIGCEVDYLLYHLQSQFTKGMNWDNYGKWHIDHKRPCISFDLSKKSEQRKCFNYTNLQPLWAKDNLTKGSKWKTK